jgi:Uma2 family endonuclease
MGMPAQEIEWTAERVRALPADGQRYELLDGELFVSPAPRPDHQSVLQRLFVILDEYVRKHDLGWVFISPADLEFSSQRYLQPDLFVVRNVGQGRPRVWKDARPLSLVVEVMSESTARADRLDKRTIYRDERIPEYWIVDADACLVESWTPDDERPAILAETFHWHPKSDVPALEINLPEFFASALD